MPSDPTNDAPAGSIPPQGTPLGTPSGTPSSAMMAALPADAHTDAPADPPESPSAAFLGTPPETASAAVPPASGQSTPDLLNALFREARTPNGWLDRPVPDTTLQAVYDLMKWAPTSANCSPARFLFLRTGESKARLRDALSAGNVERTMAAPVTVIVATDMAFFEQLPTLFPHADARSWFANDPVLADETAQRNATLQGGYFILAARAMGLDCGPMSGFDRAKVDELFLANTTWRSNFLINLGHGDPARPYPRSPRLFFDEACRML